VVQAAYICDASRLPCSKRKAGGALNEFKLVVLAASLLNALKYEHRQLLSDE